MGMKRGREYSLTEIFALLLKRLWLIAFCTVLVTAAAFFISNNVIDKEYTASVSMYVSPNAADVDRAPSLSELSYAQQVVETYIELLKTNTFMRDVADASGLGYSPSELSEMIRMDVLNDTEIFRVQVTSNNPHHSLKIAYTIAALAPQKIIEVKDADAVKVVDEAILPTVPTGPNVKINTIIGFFLGAVLSVMLVLLMDMLDNRIKDEDDIVKHYNMPVLGSVPRFRKTGGN